MTKKDWKICKERGYHNWSGEGADSYSESYNDMQVHFTCADCGAEAEGSVDWNTNDVENLH